MVMKQILHFKIIKKTVFKDSYKSVKKAFTMIELIFVILMIAILSAIALPKFSTTLNQAHLTQAKTILASLRSALNTERQKRILRGDFKEIIDLGEGKYAFSYFDGDVKGVKILEYVIEKCLKESSKICWDRVSESKYEYRFSTSGKATFKLINNQLMCDNDTINCAKIE